MTTLMRSILLSTLVLLSASAPAAQGASEPNVPRVVATPLAGDLLRACVHRLDNGLTVYLSENHQQPRISAWIAARAGGKLDPSDSTGIAHYLEHMLFKGTETIGTLDYGKERPHLEAIQALYEKLFAETDREARDRIYAEIDAENVKASEYAVPNEFDRLYSELGFQGTNAFTGNEIVAYVCDFPANRAEVWARMEADRFARAVFRLFQTEIETVYEEKNMSLDNPERILNEAQDRLLFKRHPYGQHTILGSLEHLKNPSLRKMYEYFHTYYVPGNMCVALAGDFDSRKMLKIVERHFGAWKPAAVVSVPKWDLPKPRGVERVEVKYEAEEKILISWLLPALRHPDSYALQVMDMLMDNATCGILNLELNQAQKVKESYSYAWLANDAGAYVMGAVPRKGQTLEEAEALLLGCVRKLREGEFSDEDMRAVITNFEVGEKQKLESNEARVNAMAGSFVEFREWEETVERMNRLRDVTRDDVLRVAREYLGENRVVAFRRNAKPELPSIKKPKFTKIDIDPSRQSSGFRDLIAIKAKPIRPRWLKEGRDYTTENRPWGRIYSGPNPVNDLFFLHFGFYFGDMHDRELGAAVRLLDLAGAGDMTAQQFKKKLFSYGTNLGIGCDERWFTVQLSGIDKNLEPSLELMRELFRSPNLEKDTLEKMIQVTLGAQQDNKKNPYYVHYALGELAQRGAESRVLAELKPEELGKLDAGRLMKAVSGIWRLKRHVVYVGNRPPDEIARLVDDGRDDYEDPPASRKIRLVRPAGPRVLFTHRDMVQSRVGIFAADETIDPANHINYVVFSNYLGGDMSSVVFQEIREARALAYAAWGGYGEGHWAGDDNSVYGGLATQADKTIEATELLRKLMADLPLSEERFAGTIRSIEQAYRTNPSGFRSAPWEPMRWEEQGITGGDPRPRRFKALLKYRMSDLEKFARRFNERPMTIYILGNRERVDMEKLKGLGAFEEKGLEDIFPY